MSGVDPFDGVDPEGQEQVYDHFVASFISIAEIGRVEFLHDDTISPEAVMAGLCKAHMSGLVSAILAAGRMGQDSQQLADACAVALRELVAIGVAVNGQ